MKPSHVSPLKTEGNVKYSPATFERRAFPFTMPCPTSRFGLFFAMPFGALASSPHAAYKHSVAPALFLTQSAATRSFCARWRARPYVVARCVAVFLAVVLVSSGCARPAPQPDEAFRPAQAPEITDDLGLSGLLPAIEAQRSALLKKPEREMRFGPLTIRQGDYANALDQLATELRAPSTPEQKMQFIREHFDFYELYGAERWGRVLLTGYFEPVIPGSMSPTRKFSRPLYSKPPGLLTIPLAPFASRFKGKGSLKARAQGEQVVPYYSREEIDGKGALKGRGLELAWVDPIDAFFMQIQGSGTIDLGQGGSVHLAYADKNGQAYVPIGKFLKEALAPKPVTMQGIVDTLRAMPPQERDELMFKNPSYVFFRRSQQRAVTSLGVPATPGRTIAADGAFAPKGALVFMQFEKPVVPDIDSPDATPQEAGERVGRLVLDQDSGGAITGTGRIDLFWGRGSEAGRFAGALQAPAHVWYLVPKIATQ